MNTDLANLLAESKAWLASQSAQVPQSDQWYAIGNFRSFVSTIETDPSASSIERAVHALRHFITDQYDWSADYCTAISSFCQKAEKIRRAIQNG